MDTRNDTVPSFQEAKNLASKLQLTIEKKTEKFMMGFILFMGAPCGTWGMLNKSDEETVLSFLDGEHEIHKKIDRKYDEIRPIDVRIFCATQMLEVC